MGLLDKVKAGAEQAKEMAEAAAGKAKQEAKELQLRRELANAEEALGETTFRLVESGDLAHPELTAGVERIRSIQRELTALQGS